MAAGEPEIVPANSRRLFGKFVKFPWKVYTGDSNWVPPLISEMKSKFNHSKNPFFQYADVVPFIALRAGKVVGRIAAILNTRHNEFHSEKTGFFGFFECVEDRDVAACLFAAAKQWLSERGMELIRGPVNFSSNDEWGLLIDGFDDPPAIMMPYNPPYYPALLESCGLRKAKDLYAYAIDDTAVMPEKVVRIAELVRKKTNITFRSINFARLNDEIEVLKSIYNSAWTLNWGFYPMTEEEFDYMAKELKRFAVPDLILIAEVDGKPAGFSLTLPDIYQALKRCNGRLFPFGIFRFLRDRKKIDRARVMVLGIVEGYRRRGIDALFYLETFERGKRLGYKRGELSWVLEDNVAMNSPIEAIGARLYKKYRIYEARLI
jgi:hypothetical protein